MKGFKGGATKGQDLYGKAIVPCRKDFGHIGPDKEDLQMKHYYGEDGRYITTDRGRTDQPSKKSFDFEIWAVYVGLIGLT